ncbi:MAG: DUF3488 domain-containing transglutaminase family protein [Gammaproteobacteria bacterium]|nr:DUF3488 domain-containing transglutaminase family protein [Gammaproteobacteria bacterium]
MRDALALLPIPGRLLGVLLVLLGALTAPHALNLSPSVLAFFYVAAAWRMLVIRWPAWMPGRLTLFILMLAALALVVFSTGIGDGRLAGTALLVVMLGLKLLEIRARRDIQVTVFLGYFVVMTQFLYDQSLALAVYLFAGVLALTVIQVALNREHADLRVQVRKTAGMLGAALPLTLVMFLLFPRLDSPLWAVTSKGGITGIGDDMSLGDIGHLSQSNEVAFRVTFFGVQPSPQQRYWRGPVLWHTDGKHWSGDMRPTQNVKAAGRRLATVNYETTLEPTGNKWLFGLDLVVDAPNASEVDRNGALVASDRINKRYTYRAASDPDLRLQTFGNLDRRLALQLPAALSPRVRQLATDLREQTDASDALAVAQAALRFYNENPFVYTLSPGELGDDPVDEFLFETRRGFCEHYAGSFVTLMRAAGVPARLVLGYQGGEFNPHAGHWIVRQSDAHAWAEIWVAGGGWTRVDPTAAIAPERIEQRIDTALSQAGSEIVFQAELGGMFGGLWRNAVWIADAVDLGWHRWVIGFSAERQNSLLQTLGLGELRGLGLALALLVGGALAAGLAYLIARLPKPVINDPLPRLWQRFVDKLRRGGMQVSHWQGADTICSQAMQRYPAACDQLLAINRLYVQLRYGRRRDPRQLQALRQRIRGLRLNPRRRGSET